MIWYSGSNKLPPLTLSWRRSLSYRNQSIDLLYNTGHCIRRTVSENIFYKVSLISRFDQISAAVSFLLLNAIYARFLVLKYFILFYRSCSYLTALERRSSKFWYLEYFVSPMLLTHFMPLFSRGREREDWHEMG